MDDKIIWFLSFENCEVLPSLRFDLKQEGNMRLLLRVPALEDVHWARNPLIHPGYSLAHTV